MAFDLRTEIRDPKTGKTLSTQHYTMTVRHGRTYYQRDGKWFDAAGNELPSDPFAEPKVKAEDVEAKTAQFLAKASDKK